MSTNSVRGQHRPEQSFSNSPTAASSPSSSNVTVTRQAYLDVPLHRTSRASLDSIYSELSELSLHTKERQARHLLFRNASKDSGPTRPLSPRMRIGAALQSFYITNYGAMLVVLAQFFGAGMNVSTRLLETAGPHGKPMHPFQILFARQSITAVLCTSYGLYSKSVPDFPFGPREVRWLLVARGLSGFFGVFGMYFSLLYLPLSEATVLTFLTPILTCYLCSFVMPGETFTRQQQLAGLVSLVGVIFIAQPASLFSSSSSTTTSDPSASPPSNSTMTSVAPQEPTADQHLAAIGIAMLGVLGSTGALTSIRAIGKRAHAFISINYFSVWCTFVSLAALIIFPDVKFRLPGNITEWGLLVSLGLCGFVMQCLLTVGLSYGGPTQRHVAELQNDGQTTQKISDIEGDASSASENLHHHPSPPEYNAHALPPKHPSSSSSKPKVSGSGTRATSMVYTQMLFALAADKLVFGVSPRTMSWVGSVLILAGAVWVASARDTVAKDKSSAVDSEAGGVAGRVVVDAQGRGKSEQMVEETVGLMQDQDSDDDGGGGGGGGGGLHDNQGSGSDYRGRQQTGLPTVESLELHQLRPAASER
ncbi:hypothetical protein A1O1_07423 [Capronia coronata CBS 617.96]|uniref:EamA domain-containing protein n=1 Tax=Capronia coronata CBS 617.96 TaxID=1182541 RepID=W9Y3H6_9EURO|nr:uncharacterized protein A1O1_07423 [Capronia coronata CBS 617.96]EXJ83796.1 hypothetical protein A1O1_07423 [Capronia coronata CBS 617.96]